MLNVTNDFMHECVAIRVAWRLESIDVIDILSNLLILRGVPGQFRSDNGPEMQDWIAAVGAKTASTAPESLRENGYIQSFSARLHDGLLNSEIFYALN